MPKVLIIAYHFPPSPAVGGIRPAKFAKYLPHYGWEPSILTVPAHISTPADPERLRDVNGVSIHRVAPFPTPLDVYQRIKRRLRTRASPMPLHPAVLSSVHSAPRKHAWALRRTAARYFSTVCEMPDKEVAWLLPAVARGLRVIRREGVDLIFASSPPTTAAVVGLALSALSGRPLVTDLRDPFILHAAKSADQRTAASDAVERWLERTLLQRSSQIVTTTTWLANSLAGRYPALPRDAIHTITNGYDPDDFASLSAELPDPSKFVVAYLGTFYLGRTPRELLLALGEMVREGRVDRRSLHVVFCGHAESAEAICIRALIRETGLADCVSLRGRLPYRDALLQMCSSDVLVLLAPDQSLQIPGKAFEYLAAQRPILCVAARGATAELINAFGAGHVVAPGDIAGLKSAIHDLYKRWRSGQRLIPVTDIRRYDRRNLTAELAQLFNSIVPSGHLNGTQCVAPSMATPAARNGV